MVDARHGLADGIGFTSSADADRLPRLQAAGLILVLSLAVWGVIGPGVSLVVG